MAIREIRFSQSAILKVLKDIFGAASPVGSTSTTSDSAGRIVRNPEDTEKLERWDEIVLQYKRMHLHLLFLTGEDGIEQNTIPNKIILRSSPAIAVVEVDEDLADFLHVQDQKTNATNGGSSTGGARDTRVLNTVVTNEISGASLGSNQVTLPSGTYEVKASAPSRAGGPARLFWHDGSSDIVLGLNSHASTNSDVQDHSFLYGRFTIASSTTYELQHWINVAKATNGLGVADADSAGNVEIYADVQIKKLA